MKNPKIVDVALLCLSYVHEILSGESGKCIPRTLTIYNHYIYNRIHVFIIRFEKINNYHCMRDRKRERGGNRTFNYKGLLTQYQNLRYLVEDIQSTAGEKRSQYVHQHGGLIYHGREEIHNRPKKN